MSRTTDSGQGRDRRRARWLLLLTTLPVLIITALALPVGEARAARACPPSQEFAVGGVGDTQSRFVPGAAGATRIAYAASLAPVGLTPGDVSARQGEAALNAAARSFRARCPDSAIHVTGYSMGALVAGNVRDSWNRDPKMRVNTSFTLIADPRSDHGAMAKLPSVIPGFTHTGRRPFSTIPTSSVCRSGSDFICYVGDPTRNPLPLIAGVLGYLTGDHTYRKSEVTDAPGDHLVDTATLSAGRIILAVLIPQFPLLGVLAALPAPEEVEPLLVVAQEIARTVAPDLVPPAELSLVRYIPTPLRDYLPPPLANSVPDEIGDIVLPAIPTRLDELVQLLLVVPGVLTTDPRTDRNQTAGFETILRLLRATAPTPAQSTAARERWDRSSLQASAVIAGPASVDGCGARTRPKASCGQSLNAPAVISGGGPEGYRPPADGR